MTSKSKNDPNGFALIVGGPAIEKALKLLKTQGNTLARNTHIACCSVLAHLYQHSDIKMVDKLLDAVHDMSRKNAIRNWFSAFGPVVFDGKKTKFVKREEQDNQDQARKTPFWVYDPEPDYKPVDVAKMIDSCIARLKKDAEKTGKDHALLISGLKVLTGN